MPVRNDAGIAMPTKIDARPPSTNMMMTKTSSTPVITLFCRSARSCRMVFDSSWMKETCRPCGQRFCSCSTAFLTPSTVSMTLAPVRFLISMATAGRPSIRVIVVASLKVGRISATSPSTTLAVVFAATGICSTSSGFSISAGTLTAKRPLSPSSAPAATRLLPPAATATKSLSETP